MTNESNMYSGRRAFLRTGMAGIGSLALSSLLGAETTGATQGTHFPPKAKRVIFLYMMGAPSQVDLFDHKPELLKNSGKPIPESLLKESMFAFITGRPDLLGSPYPFQRAGDSGIMISDLLPKIRAIAGDLTFIRSMHTDEVGHAAAELFLQSGFARIGRPSFGSWASYGLGTMNKDLPAYVVLSASPTYNGSNTWTSGFLPAAHQGVRLRSGPEPLFYLSNPPGITREEQASVIGAVSKLNKFQSEKWADPETEARIAQYELAFRMQSSVPELMDTSKEPESVRQMYGAKAGEPSFANDCLLARRLVERGVRFVQVCAKSWDHHENIFGLLPRSCRDVDQASAALVQDLRQRGLLDDTLVMWGGEFGRTPVVQAINPAGKRGQPGRDHLKSAFTIWMAGGGIKPGLAHGTTDDLGFRPVENPVHVHDLHATALHLLGIDHKRLTWRHQGRNFRLTDVHGTVVRDILA